MNRGDGDFNMVYGDGLTTREEKDSRLLLGNTNPMVSVGIVKYETTLSKKIISYITPVAFVASVAMSIND